MHAVVCKDAVADAYGRASLTCHADGITEGVSVTAAWYRKGSRDHLEENENHKIELTKRDSTLTVVSVGESSLLRVNHPSGGSKGWPGGHAPFVRALPLPPLTPMKLVARLQVT